MTWILTPSFIDSALTLVSLEKVDGNVRKSKRAQFKSSAHVCFFPMKSVSSTNISFVSRGFVFQNNRFLKNKSIGRGYFIEEIFLIRKKIVKLLRRVGESSSEYRISSQQYPVANIAFD